MTQVEAQQRYDLAQHVATPKEFQAWKLKEAGRSQWDIAHHLRVSRSTVRDRLRNVEKKMREAQEAA